MKPSINTKALHVGYGSGELQKVILRDLNLSLYPGELTSLIGANGTGKSTLLKTFSGNLQKLSGQVYFDGNAIESFSRIKLAQYRSIVTTERQGIDHLTVYNLVAMGRFPYTTWSGKLSQEDNVAIDKAIVLTGLSHLQNKEVNKISDGERQKAFIARALAQSTNVIILDEPTAFLDLPNKVNVMNLLKTIAKKEGKTILLTSHDLDIALLLSDKLWILNEGAIKSGVPEDLILQGGLNGIFKEQNFCFDNRSGKFVFDFEKTNHATIVGEEVGAFWLQRALERQGFHVNRNLNSSIKIEVVKSDGSYKWTLDSKSTLIEFASIEAILNEINNIT